MSDARRAYQEAAVRGAKPVRLTILLYEQVIQDVGRAGDALDKRDFEVFAHEIGHAVGVIGYLQGTLNRDAGAAVAKNLALFYRMVREKLIEGQVRSSREVLDDVRRHLLDVRDAWLKVEADSNAASHDQRRR